MGLGKKNIEQHMLLDNENFEQIIIVDDCSPEQNPYLFPEKISIFRNEKNLGYTATVNRGLRLAKPEIIVLLDSDAYPVQAYVQTLVELYNADSNIGCIGFKTVDESGTDTGNVLAEPSILSLISGQQIHALLRKYNFLASKNILPFSCAVSFRKTCLGEMNYLDEAFEMLDADNDLSMRIHRSSWKLLYEPAIIMFHKGGGSISKNSQRVILFYKSRWQLLQKHGKLVLPFFCKLLIEMRIYFELLIFNFLLIITRKKKYQEKGVGRKLLVKEIKKLALKAG